MNPRAHRLAGSLLKLRTWNTRSPTCRGDGSFRNVRKGTQCNNPNRLAFHGPVEGDPYLYMGAIRAPRRLFFAAKRRSSPAAEKAVQIGSVPDARSLKDASLLIRTSLRQRTRP